MRQISLLLIVTHHLLPQTVALSLPPTLTAPNPPPSFSCTVHLSDIPIDPITAYVTATEAVFAWTDLATRQRPVTQWEWALTDNLTFQYAGNPGAIAKVTLRPPPVPRRGPPNPMLMAYVYLGIYRGIASLTEGSSARELTVELNMLGRTLADLQI
ncbi:MAG: hypothetical protein LQ352_006037, partial [Teloschistes flavicans]